jgi:hypothetical protein
MNLFIKVLRKQLSYTYKQNMSLPDDWHNNDANNSLDSFCLFLDEERIFEAKCQTVANIPGGRYLDTIAPGTFQMKCFVEPRSFYGRIHGICNCYDLENQWIDQNSVEVNDKNRWLIHDTQNHKPKPPMTITRVAWSAGCFVMSPSNLIALGTLFDAFKMNPGDLIDGSLEDV